MHTYVLSSAMEDFWERARFRVHALCILSFRIFQPRHEKTNILHMRKQRRRSVSRNREADQRLCFRYTDSTIPLNFKPLTIFCGSTDRFVSDQVGNKNVDFSHDAAHLVISRFRYKKSPSILVLIVLVPGHW